MSGKRSTAKQSDKRYSYVTIDPRKLKLLEKNARYMRHETQTRLSENIKKDGDLEQDPFCAYWQYYSPSDSIQYDDAGDPILVVLSGNHRVISAIDAGLKEITVKVYTLPLTIKERIAKQLAHNAIVGEDDPALLKELYQDIDNIDLQEYCGLDDKTLEMLEKVGAESIGEANLDFQLISFVFLPSEIKRVKEAFEKAKTLIIGKKAFLAPFREYDAFLDALDVTSKSLEIKNVATALMAILRIFEQNITKLSQAWLEQYEKTGKKAWVPVSSIIGRDCIPVEAGVKVKKAVEKMRDRREIEPNELYKALAIWAENYLNADKA